MAKQTNRGEKTQTKQTMEFSFSVINERELFEAIKKLIDTKMPSASRNFMDLQFAVTGFQMLTILIDNIQRSQVQEYEEAYLELTQKKLEAGDLPIQIKFQCFKAFNKLVRLMKPPSFSDQWL